MRPHFLALLLFAASSGASTLTVAVDTHLVAVGPTAKMHVARVAFDGEPIVATVKLDVYSVPGFVSTMASYDDLKKLSDDNWASRLRWTVDDHKPEGTVRTIAAHARHMGPGSPEPNVKTVPYVAYEGRFALPELEPGTHTVRVSAAGLESAAMSFVVATGREPEYRDAWLDARAQHAANWSEFRQLQLERVRLDPSKAAALLALAERSEREGTLDETVDYYDRAAAAMQKNVDDYARVAPQWADGERARLKASLDRIHAVQQLLPAYFAQRNTLRIVTDAATGQVRLEERGTGRVVRTAQ